MKAENSEDSQDLYVEIRDYLGHNRNIWVNSYNSEVHKTSNLTVSSLPAGPLLVKTILSLPEILVATHLRELSHVISLPLLSSPDL